MPLIRPCKCSSRNLYVCRVDDVRASALPACTLCVFDNAPVLSRITTICVAYRTIAGPAYNHDLSSSDVRSSRAIFTSIFSHVVKSCAWIVRIVERADKTPSDFETAVLTTVFHGACCQWTITYFNRTTSNRSSIHFPSFCERVTLHKVTMKRNIFKMYRLAISNKSLSQPAIYDVHCGKYGINRFRQSTVLTTNLIFICVCVCVYLHIVTLSLLNSRIANYNNWNRRYTGDWVGRAVLFCYLIVTLLLTERGFRGPRIREQKSRKFLPDVCTAPRVTRRPNRNVDEFNERKSPFLA